MKKRHVQFFARYGVILLFAVTMLVPFFFRIRSESNRSSTSLGVSTAEGSSRIRIFALR